MTKADHGPFWRTRLATALAMWMGSSIVLMLGLGRLSELLPTWGIPIVMVAILFPVPPLLLGCIWRVIRRPRRDWPGLVSFVGFCVAFVFGFDWLMTAAGYLNFLTHRTVYERIVAEAKAGRLPVDAHGLSAGRRYGVAYSASSGPSPMVQFDWGDPHGFFGVVYSETECPWVEPAALAGQPSAAIAEKAPTSAPAEEAPPIIKNAGRLGPQWRLGGHYCLASVTM